MYKIQIKAIKREGEAEPPKSVMEWTDMVNMPELTDINDVGVWLYTNSLLVIESLGFQFRVIPVEDK